MMQHYEKKLPNPPPVTSRMSDRQNKIELLKLASDEGSPNPDAFESGLNTEDEPGCADGALSPSPCAAPLSFLSTVSCGRRGTDFSVDVVDAGAGGFGAIAVAVGSGVVAGWRAGVELVVRFAGAGGVGCPVDA